MMRDETPGVGTGSNDILALYTLASLGLGGLYVATHGRTLAPQYNEAVASVTPKEPIKAVGQLGLLYNTTHSSERVSFNSTSEDEKETREAAVVNLMRVMHKKHEAKTLPVTFKTTIVSRAGSSTTKVENKPGLLNSECKDSGEQTAWWKAKYEATPLKEAGKQHLPMTFYLEATDSDGKRIAHYGLVKSVIVEADQDILTDLGTRSNGVSYKMYMTLVDTNWRNAGGTPGKNSEINIVASQQANRCAFSAIVKDGKTYNVFVSAFAFTLHSLVHKLTDPIKPIYEAAGMVLQSDDYYKMSTTTTLARVKFHSSRDRLLGFISRALPLLDPSVVWEHGADNSMRVGGRTKKTLLPLQVHIRSNDRLNDSGDKYISYHVLEIMLRYNAKPRDPGDMRDDPAYVKAVQFKLSNNSVLAQDVNEKGTWYVNNSKLQGEPTLDLVVLSRAPESVTFKLPSEVPSITNGAQTFAAFEAPMFGGTKVSLDKEEYDRQRGALNGSKPDGDLTLEKDATPPPPPLLGEKTWMVLVPLLFLFFIGWKFANPRLAASTAKLAHVICFAGAIAAAGMALAEHRDWTGVLGYDSVVLVAVGVCVVLALAASLFAIRLSPDVSACVGIGAASAVLAAFVAHYMTLPRDGSLPGAQLTSTRVVLLLVVSQALGLLAIETGKLEAKVYSGALPSTVAVPGVPLLTFLTFCAGMIYFFGYLGTLTRAPDACLDVQAEVDRLGKTKHTPGSIGAKLAAQEQDRAFEALGACETNKMGLPPALTQSWWIPAVVGVAGFLAAQVALTFLATTLVRSVLPSGVAPVRAMVAEDGRSVRGRWMLKTLVGLTTVGITLRLLYPMVEWKSPECDAARADAKRERLATETDTRPPQSQRMTMIESDMTRLGCSTTESIAVTSAAAPLLVLLVASMVVPVTQKFMYRKASSPQAFGLFAYACTLAVVAAWAAKPETRDYFMKNKLAR